MQTHILYTQHTFFTSLLWPYVHTHQHCRENFETRSGKGESTTGPAISRQIHPSIYTPSHTKQTNKSIANQITNSPTSTWAYTHEGTERDTLMSSTNSQITHTFTQITYKRTHVWLSTYMLYLDHKRKRIYVYVYTLIFHPQTTHNYTSIRT
jgi:hypothetical protein